MKSTSRLVYEELTSRGIAIHHLPTGEKGENSFFTFEYKNEVHMMSGVSTDLTSSTARTICDNKDITAFVAHHYGFKMPSTTTYDTDENAEAFLREHHQVVVKPADSAHGNGVTTDITSVDQLLSAIERACKVSSSQKVLLQQQVKGDDYRVLVIDNQTVAVSKRIPASVVGDGAHTIEELIAIENESNPKRGANYEKLLNYIDLEAAKTFLGSGMTTVPGKGETVKVVGVANMGMGGKATNMTSAAPKAMTDEAERLTKLIGSFITGVDFMYDAVTKQHYLIELNSSPSFGLHQSPSEGDPVDVTQIFVDKLLARYDAKRLTTGD